MVLLNAPDMSHMGSDENFVLHVIPVFSYVYGGWQIASVVWWWRMLSALIPHLLVKALNCVGTMTPIFIVACMMRQVTICSSVSPEIDSSDIGCHDPIND